MVMIANRRIVNEEEGKGNEKKIIAQQASLENRFSNGTNGVLMSHQKFLIILGLYKIWVKNEFLSDTRAY